MRFLIVSLLLSLAGVTFSANDDDGDAIVNRNERMSILAEADAAKATTEEPSSDSDDESTADPSSDSDDESTADLSSDSDDESTADPSSDSDEEGTANPSSDSDDDDNDDDNDKSSTDSDQENEGISEISEGCPCGCPRHLVSPPICMRIWLNNPDFGAISRAGNQCVYNCYRCRAARMGFKVKRVKPTSMKTCPENTDNSKQCLRILRRVVLFQTQMPRRHNGGDPLGASRFQETRKRKMLQSSQQLLPRLHQQGLQRRLYVKC